MRIKLVPAKDVIEEQDDVEKKVRYIIDYFLEHNPEPKTDLNYRNPYELIVAAILSAQCQDKRVNAATRELFKVYPTVEDLAKADPEKVYLYISTITYPVNKSGYLVDMANMIVNRYHGKIPEDENELQKLPGVGRKTANLVASILYNKPKIAVDTHVFRVAERIGLTTGAKTPADTEKQLSQCIPKDAMSKISHWLILHGRNICSARDPKCYRCGINKVCRYYYIDMM